MKNTKTVLGSLFMIFLSLWVGFIFLNTENTPKNLPTAHQGVLDVHGYNFDGDKVVPLKGQWLFYWHRLPSDIGPHVVPTETQVPHTWENIPETRHQAMGYATYQLKIIGLRPSTPYGIKLYDQATAFRVIINNSLVASNGTIGRTPQQARAEWKPSVGIFTSSPTGDAFVTVEVSNFSYNRGGLWNSILLGSVSGILKEKMASTGQELFLATSILMFGLFFMGIFFMHPSEKPTLWFSAFCINTGLYTLMIGERIITWFPFSIPWDVAIRLEYILGYLILPLYGIYLTELYREFSHRSIRVMFRILAGVAVLLPLCTAHAFYSSLIDSYKILAFMVTPIIIYLIAQGLKNSYRGAWLTVVACATLFMGLLNDTLAQTEYSAVPWVTFFFVLCFSLITIQKYTWLQKKNAVLESKVIRDSLTGLYNREYLKDRFDAYQTAPFFLLFLDLDGFKRVNDTCGHDAGDVVLSTVAKRMERHLPDEDILFRYGGDEFILFSRSDSEDSVIQLAEALLETCKQPFQVGEQVCHIGCSIGVSQYPNDSLDLYELIRFGDEAMYLAKQEGGNQTVIYGGSAPSEYQQFMQFSG